IAALFLAAAWGALALQDPFRGNPVGRRPLVAQFAVLISLVAAAASLPLPPLAAAGLWTFIGVYASSFWLLGYAFANLKMKDRGSPALHTGYLRPFWGGDITPIGKGMAFLRKFEARDDTALAAMRLNALKLLRSEERRVGRGVDTEARRDFHVTGVQTCALPISSGCWATPPPTSR